MDVREKILMEALHLFGSIGYESTSLQKIAAAVGVTKQALLYHFSSKEDLHRAVIESVFDYWRRELPIVLANTPPGHACFHSTMGALLDFFGSEPSCARAALREMLDRPDALSEGLRRRPSTLVRMITGYIRMGQASGWIQPELDPESYVVQILTVVISSAAIGSVVNTIVEASDPARQKERDQAELVRIARRAAFVPAVSKHEKE
ncbi:MAG: Biofilm operon icaADBC HTH-type negative transcriptional regulator IcaR [Candidatus Hydrogenedentes bacterium ADurb.Bin179]|nr:MAG: Biofilm operon icaADBC HTH-type negative transcriptional regulator IcaR [Candidatus Hydrogenedentes bacterium ADurb.Bin179]